MWKRFFYICLPAVLAVESTALAQMAWGPNFRVAQSAAPGVPIHEHDIPAHERSILRQNPTTYQPQASPSDFMTAPQPTPAPGAWPTNTPAPATAQFDPGAPATYADPMMGGCGGDGSCGGGCMACQAAPTCNTGCGPCCGGLLSANPTARLRIWGDAVWLQRSSPEPFALTTVSATGATIFDMQAIDYDRTVAPMISAALQLTDNWGIGGSYLSADWDWAQQPYRGASETVHYMGIQLAGNPLELDLRSETEYTDWQINLRRTFRVANCRCVTVWAGYREKELTDTFFIGTPDDRVGDFLDMEGDNGARNSLRGAQIGGEVNLLQLAGGRVRLHLQGNYGYYQNDASIRGSIPFLATEFEANDSVNTTSADVALTAVWQVTRRLALRGGYQWLWIKDAALATNQLDPEYNNALALEHAVNFKEFTADGLFGGVEFTW